MLYPGMGLRGMCSGGKGSAGRGMAWFWRPGAAERGLRSFAGCLRAVAALIAVWVAECAMIFQQVWKARHGKVCAWMSLTLGS